MSIVSLQPPRKRVALGPAWTEAGGSVPRRPGWRERTQIASSKPLRTRRSATRQGGRIGAVETEPSSPGCSRCRPVLKLQSRHGAQIAILGDDRAVAQGERNRGQLHGPGGVGLVMGEVFFFVVGRGRGEWRGGRERGLGFG